MTKYRAEVFVEIELEDPEDFEGAFKIVDETMQRAWDTDQGRWKAHKWHYEMLEDCVTVVEEAVDNQSP